MSTKVLKVAKSGNCAPLINLDGKWLSGFGFHADVLVLGEFSKGRVVLTAKGCGIEAYKELSPSVRANGSSLFQVTARKRGGKASLALSVTGKQVAFAGFAPGDVYAVYCEQGVLTVVKIDTGELAEKE